MRSRYFAADRNWEKLNKDKYSEMPWAGNGFGSIEGDVGYGPRGTAEVKPADELMGLLKVRHSCVIPFRREYTVDIRPT